MKFKTFETDRLIIRPTSLEDAAFNEFGIIELSAITNKENKSSQILLKKLGLKKMESKSFQKVMKNCFYTGLKSKNWLQHCQA